MRNDYPSHRWLKQFDRLFIEAGGHNGHATLNAMRQSHGVPLYRKGATAAAAASAAAAVGTQQRRLEQAEEAAGWR